MPTHQIIVKNKKHTNAILRPTSSIHKVRKNEFSTLMRLRSGRYRDHNDKPAQERRKQRDFCDPRQPPGVAIPDKGEAIDEEVSDIDGPGLYNAMSSSAPALMAEVGGRRYKSG